MRQEVIKRAREELKKNASHISYRRSSLKSWMLMQRSRHFGAAVAWYRTFYECNFDHPMFAAFPHMATGDIGAVGGFLAVVGRGVEVEDLRLLVRCGVKDERYALNFRDAKRAQILSGYEAMCRLIDNEDEEAVNLILGILRKNGLLASGIYPIATMTSLVNSLFKFRRGDVAGFDEEPMNEFLSLLIEIGTGLETFRVEVS